MQALEVVNCILDRPAFIGKLVRYDGQSMTQSIAILQRDTACPVCV